MYRKFTVVLFCIVFTFCRVCAGLQFNIDFKNVVIDNVKFPINATAETTGGSGIIGLRTNFSCNPLVKMPGESVVLDDNDEYCCIIEFECPEVDNGLVQMSFDFMVCRGSADAIHLSLKDNNGKNIAVIQYVNSNRSLMMVEYEPADTVNDRTPIGPAETYKIDTVHHLDIVLDLDSETICFGLDGNNIGSAHPLPGGANFVSALFNTPVTGKARIALDNIYLGDVILTCGENLSSPCDYNLDDDIRLAAVEELVRRPVSGPGSNILIWRLFAMAKNDSNPQVRGAATSALIAIGDEAHPRIKDLLNDQSNQSRRIRRTTITALRGGKVIDSTIESLFAPEPEPIVYVYDPQQPSELINGGFEDGITVDKITGKKIINGWTVTYHDRAKGSEFITTNNVHGGTKALQVTKDNGKGYIRIRSKDPVGVPVNKIDTINPIITTCRLWFKSDNAPLESQLLLRAEDINGILTDGYGQLYTCESQTFLSNTARGQWHKRVMMLKPEESDNMILMPNGGKPYFVQILLFGNPCTVTIDDVSLPAPNWDFVISDPTQSQFLPGWENIYDELINQPNFTAAVAKCSDKVTIRIDDGIAYDDISPVLHKPVTNSRGDYAAFQDAGVSLQTIFIKIGSNNSFKKWCNNGKIEDVPTIWQSAAKTTYDFSYAIEQVKEAVSKAPDSYFIIDFWVVWPDDYVTINPETAWRNQIGKKAYGSILIQPKGFGDGSWITPKGYIWLPSPYQDKPIHDAGVVLREFMKSLNGTPYHKRVVGCCISGGHDGQFYIQDKDYSPYGKASWQKWLRDKYVNDVALQAAWNNQNVTLNNVEVPVDTGNPNSKMFFDPAHETDLRDYREFRFERMWKIKEMLIKYAEQGAGKPLIGLAYTLGGGMENDFRPLFLSSYLDGCIAQPIYQYRMPGHIGGIHAAYDSFTKYGKLMIKEMDTRSWIREAFNNEITSMYLSTPMSLDEFKKLCRKEIGQQLAHNQGWWYYDIDDNSFRDPDIMKEIAMARSVVDCVRQAEDSFKPDAVALYSHDSYLWGRRKPYGSHSLSTWILEYLEMEIAASGVPMDRMYIQDLIDKDPIGEDYKMYVFMNCYALTGSQISYIENNLKTANKTLIWHYAPGYVDIKSKKLSADNTSSLVDMTVITDLLAPLTDYKVLASDKTSHSLIANSRPIMGVGDMFLKQFYKQFYGSEDLFFAQRFVINDVHATTLGTYTNNDIALAVIDMDDGANVWRSIYASALGALSSELLNNAANDAGCYVATEPGCVALEINGRFLSLHALKEGIYNIRLPYSCCVFDLNNGHVYGINNEIDIPLNATESKWLFMVPCP